MKVDGSLKSLLQGVSQQPARNRLPGQCTAQDNCSSNPVDGLTRRPPIDHIADLFTAADNPKFHHFSLGEGQDYVLVALEEDLKVFDLAGNEKTVNEIGSAFDYLDGGELSFASLDNQTFVANKAILPAMESTVASVMDYGCIVYLLGGQYGRTYTITVNWKTTGSPGTAQTTTVSHTTPDGSSVAHGAQVATDYIAAALKTLLDADTTNNFNTTFTTTRVGDVLLITWDDSRTDVFECVVNDGEGGTHIYAVNNSVTHIGLLPRYAPQGYHVKVTGDGSASQDDWYLEFSVKPDDDGIVPAVAAGFGKSGVWVETVKNDIPYLMDLETMPHVLEYDSVNDDFDFFQGDWAGRQVGDEDSNENPSFIGTAIEDLGYFQGRLVMLAGAAVIMSRTNKPFDFWIETATAVTDTDAIDIESTANGVSKMLRAVPHNRDLVIFSDGGQFIVFGRNALTPANASLVLTTAFEANLNAAPVPAGRNIFFPINYGNFTGIREFYTEGAEDINDSRPITQHVLKYIEGRVAHMASSSNFDTLLVQTVDDKSILYLYEYIWVNDQKAQSSWSRWLLPNDVVFFFFVESVIYTVTKIGDNYTLEKLDLDIQSDTDVGYQVKLDRRMFVEDVNFEIENLLVDMPDIEDMVFVQGTGCPHPGLRVIVSDYDEGTNTITFEDDMDGGTVICGQRYRSSYMPTIPTVKDSDGVKVGTGKLVIGKFFINTRESGDIYGRKTSLYHDPVETHLPVRFTGDPSTVVGEAAIADVVHVLPFRDHDSDAEIEIYTESHEPMTIMDIEWTGQYVKRGKRITQGD